MLPAMSHQFRQSLLSRTPPTRSAGIQFYQDEFVDDLVAPVIAVLCRLSEERVTAGLSRLLGSKDRALAPLVDGPAIVCLMFEVALAGHALRLTPTVHQGMTRAMSKAYSMVTT